MWAQYATGDGKAIRTYANEPDGRPAARRRRPVHPHRVPKNDIALFQRNPNWYGTPPHIDGFGLQFFRDEDAMVTALKTGQLDAINEIPPTSVDTLKSSGMQVYEGQALAMRDFIFNLDPSKPDHPELLNPKVREAFEYAIDRNAIVQTAWLGYATPGSTLIPEGNATGGTQWHDDQIQPLPFNIDKANQILDDLGYARGSDDIRVANGVPMSYDVIFPLDEAGAGDRAFRIIQQGMQQIGVQLNQKRLDSNAAWDAMYQNGHYVYDLAMWDWFPAADPDFILSVITCDECGQLERRRLLQPRLRQALRRAEDGDRPAGSSVDHLQDAVDRLQRPALHHPDLRQAAGRLVAALAGARGVHAGDLQQLLDAEPAVRPPSVRTARPADATGRGLEVRRSDYLIKRALFAIVTVFVAITINFFLFRVLPGSAVRNLSRVPNATPELQQSLEAQFGLDKPIWQQYVIYVQQLFHGNLGVSFSNQQPVCGQPS